MLSVWPMKSGLSDPPAVDLNKALLEVKLCRRLLDLGRERELEPFLGEALRLNRGHGVGARRRAV